MSDAQTELSLTLCDTLLPIKNFIGAKLANDAAELAKAREARAELWGLLCPDAGPGDWDAIIEAVRKLTEGKP